MPKRISPDVKARAMRMYEEHRADYPTRTAAAAAVARHHQLGQETVRRWIAQAEVDAGSRPGVTSAEQVEIKQLRAENRRLREDVEILRAATTFFAGELDSRNR